MNIANTKAYELVSKKRIEELQTDGYILRHIKTGARVVLMENDDENKVFYIGFRTPPSESTGVMHILEHSVLCGSKKFPVKDPFIELAKGSLNTFLNAMTYPDKTVYPVASCNDKDFQNLMHIYLDAVFYPNILLSDKTFRQEGWHYELADRESNLEINGVVYSEMKGAFSNPDDVLERTIFNSLFPDTPYSEESGGDPKVIPELTYEHYIDVYKQYYHPSNSYIFLYGNMDMLEKLEFIDKEYLSDFDAIDIDSSLPLQKAFDKPIDIVSEYPITESEPVDENSYLSYNCAMNTNLDRDEYIAWQIIDYALCSSQGAVLKKALLDAGIGKDIYSQYDNGVRQPYFSIVAKYTDEAMKEKFIKTVDDTLLSIVNNGFDKDTLLAGLNSLEFKYREADFGSYPPGLMYGLQALDSWLYDDDKPFIHIEADDTFKKLRKLIDTDYFEQLVSNGLINNTHKSYVTVVPSIGLASKEDEELKKQLADYKQSLSDDELDRLIADTEELLAYQEEEDTPEALACIPVLEIEDIEKKTAKIYNEIREINGYKVLYHPIHTNGIDYARLIFNVTDIPGDLFPYLGLLKNIIGLVDTANYSYGELFNKIFMETGGVAPALNNYEDCNDPDKLTITFDWKGKCLEGDLDKVFNIYEEIILTSCFNDRKRILELLQELKSKNQDIMMSAGHIIAAHRALSYISKSAAVSDMLSGMDAYRLIEMLENDYDNLASEAIGKLERLSKLLFRQDNLMLDFAGSESEYKIFADMAVKLAQKLPKSVDDKEETYVPELVIRNEGFTSAAQVQYVGVAGNYKKHGLEYNGSMKVLKVIMGYDYLWNNIRVKGGAYGCMSAFTRNGNGYFVSYRDPNLSKTLDVYEGAVEYINNFEADSRAMTQYIIGAISELDTPLTPSAKAIKGMSLYMSGLTEDALQKERDELLATDVQSIRALAKMVRAILDDGCLCAVGNEDKIKAEADIFDNVEPLFIS